MTAAQRIASFSSALTLDAVPDAVVDAAKLHVLDALGTGLAAHGLGVAEYALSAAAEAGVNGASTVIGLGGGLPAADAALANGTLCHALDFDDTHTDSVAHVSVAVAPAALAAAQELGCSGAEALSAIIAGNEVVVRVGMAAPAEFHARGFHPTAVCGVFGATAAVAKLRGLSDEQMTNALGIAGSMASGLLEFLADGSATKPIHPGWAGHAAITAARLAAHGATGPATVFEGRFGLFKAYIGRELDFETSLSDLGQRWETPNIAFKPYPACHYVHASLDALQGLIDEETIGAEDVEEIVALTTAAGVSLVLEPLAAKQRPRSEYDAKFSLPYSLASLLINGSVDVATYAEPAISDERVIDLAARVRYEVEDFPTFPEALPGGVRVRTRDGRIREARLPHQRGGPGNPMSTRDVVEKFHSNAALALPGDTRAQLESSLLEIERLPDLGALRALGQAQRREVTA